MNGHEHAAGWFQVYTGKLSLVDLAGSERASETNNVGRQLKDGANINRYTLHFAVVTTWHPCTVLRKCIC